jgi:Fic family protein
MLWNWQQKDWPHFTYDTAQITPFEDKVLYEAGALFGAFKHLGSDEQTQLAIEVISDESLKTSEIEGEYFNRQNIQSSVRRQFGLEDDLKGISLAEQGISQMMVEVYQTFSEPLTHETLFIWHKMVMAGRKNLTDIGHYRTHLEPMQIVSGYIDSPKVHFEAPPSHKMHLEMEQFIHWFNQTSPQGQHSLPVLTRAAIAHLYFESIHPFEDGNGRIGRAIAAKALDQSLGQPALIALAHVIEKHKKAYYGALEGANKSNEITAWILYFAKTILDGIAYTQLLIDFLIKKAKLYDKLRGKLNTRQEKAMARMFREGLEGFKGGMSADKYMSITKAPRSTASRDLHDLVTKGALVKTGVLRHTRYYVNI